MTIAEREGIRQAFETGPLARLEQAFRDAWRPEQDVTVSEWAGQHRQLAGRSGAVTGQWENGRTPFLVEIMDCLSSSHWCESVTFMKGAQIGGTEAGNNWLGWIIDVDPGPILMVEPSLDMVSKISKQRIAPMIEETERLRAKVAAARSRDSGNSTMVKEFPDGILIMAGANSPAGLRSMPIRYLFADEVDEYKGDIGGQGDPCALMSRRTNTFRGRKKIFWCSTPTYRGLSRIEKLFNAGDQRRYHVPCPLCGHLDWIQWTIGGWRGDQGRHHSIWFDETLPPEEAAKTARMRCGNKDCDALIDEEHKPEMLSGGRWVAHAPGTGKQPSFHLSALYSPLGWLGWDECVLEFLRVKNDVFALKTWVNTVLGETFEEEGQSLEPEHVRARLEDFPVAQDGKTLLVPNGAGALVAAVDVQVDRLEMLVKAFGAREESWTIAHERIFGDPAQSGVWNELNRLIAQRFEHQSGRKLRLERIFIDSGGHHTEHVYKYCATRWNIGVMAIKGGNLQGRPLLDGMPSNNNSYRAPLQMLCVDTGRQMVLARLRQGKPPLDQLAAPGYIHLPRVEWIDEEFLRQLTALRAVPVFHKKRGVVREWKNVHPHDHIFDMEVYSLGALYSIPGILRELPERAKRWAEKPEPSKDPKPGSGGPPRQGPRGGGWVTRF